MGTRGPIPKRSESRQRRNKTGDVVSAPGAAVVKAPNASSKWSPVAKRMWNAAKDSGQSRFYEPSDWALLYLLCDELTAYAVNPRKNAMMFNALLSGFSSLMFTEGDRRRLQIELERPTEEVESAGITVISEWQSRLTGNS